MDQPHIYALQHPIISTEMTLEEKAAYHLPGLWRGIMLSTMLTVEHWEGRWRWHASVAVYRPPAPRSIPWAETTPTEQDAALTCLARMMRDIGPPGVKTEWPQEYEQGIHVWVPLTETELLALPAGLAGSIVASGVM